jgi:hypothetical protein
MTDVTTLEYFEVLIVFIFLIGVARAIDYYLKEREDREFREYVARILEQEDELPTKEQIFLEMETIKEALIQAYEMEDNFRVKYLGKQLNHLRKLLYY